MILSRRLGTVLLAVAGALSVSGAAAAQEYSCPTTASFSPPEFILPTPYDSLPQPKHGSFWYGTQALWTQLSNDGTWGTVYREDLHAYRNKLVVWRPGVDVRAGQSDITVTARRLDRGAPTVSIPRMTNVFAEDIGPAMMTAVDLPTTGCWEFTVRYAADSLTFVVSVP